MYTYGMFILDHVVYHAIPRLEYFPDCIGRTKWYTLVSWKSSCFLCLPYNKLQLCVGLGKTYFYVIVINKGCLYINMINIYVRVCGFVCLCVEGGECRSKSQTRVYLNELSCSGRYGEGVEVEITYIRCVTNLFESHIHKVIPHSNTLLALQDLPAFILQLQLTYQRAPIMNIYNIYHGFKD